MQKCIDKGAELQIRSVIALDHLKNYIYVEADKEAHVTEVCQLSFRFQNIQNQTDSMIYLIIAFIMSQACKGMRNIFTGSKILLVPIKEMTDVLAVESKAIELARDTWVRMKIGTYKGDLAKVRILTSSSSWCFYRYVYNFFFMISICSVIGCGCGQRTTKSYCETNSKD